MNETNTNTKSTEVKKETKTTEKIAVILIRGLIDLKPNIKSTLRMLNLQKRNACIILENNPVNMGMIKKVQNYVTYGPINQETLTLLKTKRPTAKKYYSLHPPRGGFERKGIKKTYNEKGALGNRDKKINELIQKML